MFTTDSVTKGCNIGVATDIDRFYYEIGEDEKFLQCFTNTVLSREEWSEVLAIERSTIWRWEKEVIEKVRSIKEEYWVQERSRFYYLDPYQRFLIAYIRSLKKGTRATYRSVRITLIKSIDQLKRTQFESWRKSNELV